MRAELANHFDVVVVIWVLALAVGWSLVAITHSDLRQDQWSNAPQAQSGWVFTTNAN